MIVVEKTDFTNSAPRSFAVTESSGGAFLDIKAMIERDNLTDWLLPFPAPDLGERLLHGASVAAGPLFLIAAYAAIGRYLL